MRHVLFAAVTSATMLLGACDPTAPSAQDVVNGVKQSCDIAVPVADIAALITASTPSGGAVLTVDALVKAVCGAVQAQQSNMAAPKGAAGGAVIVNGVLVHWTPAP